MNYFEYKNRQTVYRFLSKYRSDHYFDPPLTSCEILSITEILKERKNQLVQEMHDEMWKQIHTPSMGDIVTEDYAFLSLYGLGLFFLRFPFAAMQNPHIIGFQQGIGFSIAAICLHHLSQYRYEIRSREAEMDKFDIIIEKIESFYDAFIQQLSDECDFWIQEAQLTNSFAAKQQIIQNVYAHLDKLSEKDSSEKLKEIYSKVDQAVENLAQSLQISIKDLKN